VAWEACSTFLHSIVDCKLRKAPRVSIEPAQQHAPAVGHRLLYAQTAFVGAFTQLPQGSLEAA
jgi:hypothetical protein